MERAELAANDCAIVRLQNACYVHGCYVHKELHVWEAAIANIHVFLAEPAKTYDRNTIAVEKLVEVIGQVPQSVMVEHFFRQEVKMFNALWFIALVVLCNHEI